MDENTKAVTGQALERVAARLRKSNMDAIVLQRREEVVPLLQTLLAPGQSVACGGSVTLDECGVLDFLRAGPYEFWDRYDPQADRMAMMKKALLADTYLASANAITEKGEIYQIDGMGNRVAAITFGPERVIMVVGCNKLVPDLDAARKRRAAYTAPANVRRLGIGPPCAETGYCVNCKSDARICCKELVLYHQQPLGRYTVVLVNEALGY